MIPQDTRVEMICEKGMVDLEKMHTSGIFLATPLKIMTKAELADRYHFQYTWKQRQTRSTTRVNSKPRAVTNNFAWVTCGYQSI